MITGMSLILSIERYGQETQHATRIIGRYPHDTRVSSALFQRTAGRALESLLEQAERHEHAHHSGPAPKARQRLLTSGEAANYATLCTKLDAFWAVHANEALCSMAAATQLELALLGAELLKLRQQYLQATAPADDPLVVVNVPPHL